MALYISALRFLRRYRWFLLTLALLAGCASVFFLYQGRKDKYIYSLIGSTLESHGVSFDKIVHEKGKIVIINAKTQVLNSIDFFVPKLLMDLKRLSDTSIKISFFVTDLMVGGSSTGNGRLKISYKSMPKIEVVVLDNAIDSLSYIDQGASIVTEKDLKHVSDLRYLHFDFVKKKEQYGSTKKISMKAEIKSGSDVVNAENTNLLSFIGDEKIDFDLHIDASKPQIPIVFSSHNYNHIFSVATDGKLVSGKFDANIKIKSYRDMLDFIANNMFAKNAVSANKNQVIGSYNMQRFYMVLSKVVLPKLKQHEIHRSAPEDLSIVIFGEGEKMTANNIALAELMRNF